MEPDIGTCYTYSLNLNLNSNPHFFSLPITNTQRNLWGYNLNSRVKKISLKLHKIRLYQNTVNTNTNYFFLLKPNANWKFSGNYLSVPSADTVFLSTAITVQNFLSIEDDSDLFFFDIDFVALQSDQFSIEIWQQPSSGIYSLLSATGLTGQVNLEYNEYYFK
jgi:hypothetical protein